MNLTLARVRKVVRLAMDQNGIEGEVVDASWYSTCLCTPKFGNGPKFKNARCFIESNGRRVRKFVVLESNGGWCVK